LFFWLSVSRIKVFFSSFFTVMLIQCL
jgi:hypothetical protein